MNCTYQLDENDYLTHLLFTISKSSSANKTRTKIRLLVTISLLLFAFISFGNHSKGQAIYFTIMAMLTFLFMPLYTRWSYKKTYLKHVRKFYQERMSETTNVTISEKDLTISDSKGNSTMSISDIEAINELNDYYYLLLKSGPSIILPKQKIENNTELEGKLKQLSTAKSIPWNDETNWIWK